MANAKFWQDEIDLYLADIADSNPLSSEREKELAERIKKGDTEARNELVEANLRFVVWVAKEYRNRGLPMSDIISAGNLGLIIASERFDGERGFRFISYAVWWIRQAIMQALNEQVRTIRLPTSRIGLIDKINETEETLSQNGVEFPSPEDFAAAIGVKVKEIRETLLAGMNTVSLDSEFRDSDERNLLDVIPDESELPDISLEKEELIGMIRRELSCLDDRSERILRLYFGLDGDAEVTLEEIGVLFGLTRERVRQIKEKALHSLRQPAHRRELEVFVGGEEKGFIKPNGPVAGNNKRENKANGSGGRNGQAICRQDHTGRLERNLYRRFGSDTVKSVIADYDFYIKEFGCEPPADELVSIYSLIEEGVEEILKLARERKK